MVSNTPRQIQPHQREGQGHPSHAATAVVSRAAIAAQAEDLASATLITTYTCCKLREDTSTQVSSLSNSSFLPDLKRQQACWMSLWTWSTGTRLASSLFRHPWIHKEEKLWEVEMQVRTCFPAFFFLSLLDEKNGAFGAVSPCSAGRGSQREQRVPSSSPLAGWGQGPGKSVFC